MLRLDEEVLAALEGFTLSAVDKRNTDLTLEEEVAAALEEEVAGRCIVAPLESTCATRRVARCEEAVGSEPLADGAHLAQRIDQLETDLGVSGEGSLEERLGAIERLIELDVPTADIQGEAWPTAPATQQGGGFEGAFPTRHPLSRDGDEPPMRYAREQILKFARSRRSHMELPSSLNSSERYLLHAAASAFNSAQRWNFPFQARTPPTT
ncbi:hypothetical protein EMIHUDRAFT_205630 [Emiliania huxleyi CCMP1516]|uniref:R3H domain-containing protein n=2 Tax=Emiliania huxleyi TaxID=2903 RepID=A0A0D3JSQ9_EMIH1|nr:hypothetical protein EMIHUDRAFT_205630 [Emiliania huxleyi CCMP1516]EOD26544.1 hypothetical protein EMIHUDRAFT_205630 [Emiliania huxleyi CCMP1516]|eukprot:XP_005778973.1 hypothetical protein EMIHUDRAFT_205630 [Emiliania huxleyi CCMP1516]